MKIVHPSLFEQLLQGGGLMGVFTLLLSNMFKPGLLSLFFSIVGIIGTVFFLCLLLGNVSVHTFRSQKDDQAE